jgi:hypothetical protein
VPLFGSTWDGYTFTVELRSSGLVRIHHESVKDPSAVPDAPAWILPPYQGVIVGLRFGQELVNRTLLTSAQQGLRSSWLSGGGSTGSGMDGLYADRTASFTNRTYLDFCPVPTRLCLAAASGPGTTLLNPSHEVISYDSSNQGSPIH